MRKKIFFGLCLVVTPWLWGASPTKVVLSYDSMRNPAPVATNEDFLEVEFVFPDTIEGKPDAFSLHAQLHVTWTGENPGEEGLNFIFNPYNGQTKLLGVVNKTYFIVGYHCRMRFTHKLDHELEVQVNIPGIQGEKTFSLYKGSSIAFPKRAVLFVFTIGENCVGKKRRGYMDADVFGSAQVEQETFRQRDQVNIWGDSETKVETISPGKDN